MKDLNSQFILEIAKIKEPEIFLGVARILKVQLLNDEKDEDGHFKPRAFEEVCADVIESYAHSDRRRKRELLKLLRQSNKGGIEDADRTKDSETNPSNQEM